MSVRSKNALRRLRPDLLGDVDYAIDAAKQLSYWEQAENTTEMDEHFEALRVELKRELVRFDDLLGLVYRTGVRALQARSERAPKGKAKNNGRRKT